MARAQMEQRVSNRTEESSRSRTLGDLHAYQEQQCPACNAYQPHFSTRFGECRECRGVERIGPTTLFGRNGVVA
jgi:hypothetical protein